MKDEEKPTPALNPSSKAKFKLSGMQHIEAPILSPVEDPPPEAAPTTEVIETTEE